MPIAATRRIFRASPVGRAARPAMGRTVIAGLVGAIGGAALVLFAMPADLFGRVPPPPASSQADARQVAVVDGETLRLGETRWCGCRASRRRNAARPAGARTGRMDCGAAATEALAGLVAGHGVDLPAQRRGPAWPAPRPCDAGGVDLNRAHGGRRLGAGATHGAALGVEAGQAAARQDASASGRRPAGPPSDAALIAPAPVDAAPAKVRLPAAAADNLCEALRHATAPFAGARSPPGRQHA